MRYARLDTLVDRDGLADALESGHLAGYTGDVWYPQPAPADHRSPNRPGSVCPAFGSPSER